MSDAVPPPPGSAGDLPGARNEPKAIASLVCGLVGLLFCGIVLGVVAIVLGNQAKSAIAQSGGALKGAGLAQAGFVLGVIDVIVGIIFIVFLL